MTTRLTLQGVFKIFGEKRANDAMSLEVMPGEIVAVLGENGARKGTLTNIVYGVVRPDAGSFACDAFPDSDMYAVPRSCEVPDESFDAPTCRRTPGRCFDGLFRHADRA